MSVSDRFEYATAGDPAQNYCLWDYPPPAPADDKFRSINLLFQSFESGQIDPRAFEVVDAIRDGIGAFRTVFGVKLVEGRLAWEFYFYDYARRERFVSISRVMAAIERYLPCAIQPNEALPYFMFSLDLSTEILQRSSVEVVHMYVGNPGPGNTVSSGIAYAVRRSSVELENFYFFFDAASQMDQVAAKISSSAFIDALSLDLRSIIVPELCRCQTICVANKQTHDCIYFSGVDIDQLLLFLERFSYPIDVIDWVRRNRGELDHLLFDVGFDYRVETGTLHILKSGYYGVF